MTIQQQLSARKLLSAAVIDKAEHAVPLAKALLSGGLDIMEVTFRNQHAAECIRRIRAEVPEMTIGAGTILSPEQMDQAIEAGALFALSPGFNPTVVKASIERDFFFIPGVMTPGEIEQSLELGCPWVKLYPASELGLSFIQAIAAPYAHTPLRIIPLGGINEQNICDYLAAPLVAAAGGSWLTNRQLTNAAQWDRITELTRQTLKIIS